MAPEAEFESLYTDADAPVADLLQGNYEMQSQGQ